MTPADRSHHRAVLLDQVDDSDLRRRRPAAGEPLVGAGRPINAAAVTDAEDVRISSISIPLPAIHGCWLP